MNKREIIEKIIISDAEVISLCDPIRDIQPYYNMYLEKYGNDITKELFKKYFDECIQGRALKDHDLVEIKINDKYYIMTWAATEKNNPFILDGRIHEGIIRVIRNEVEPEYDLYLKEKNNE